MVKIQILTVNRPDTAWDSLIKEYLQRMGRYADVKWRVLKPICETDVVQARRKNTRQLLAAVPTGSWVVLLDEQGAEWNTEQLAQKLANWSLEHHSLSFIVGGAEGVEREQLSSYPSFALSRLTLPHRLAQLVLVEQLYRAFSMQHNHPYHRA